MSFCKSWMLVLLNLGHNSPSPESALFVLFFCLLIETDDGESAIVSKLWKLVYGCFWLECWSLFLCSGIASLLDSSVCSALESLTLCSVYFSSLFNLIRLIILCMEAVEFTRIADLRTCSVWDLQQGLFMHECWIDYE